MGPLESFTNVPNEPVRIASVIPLLQPEETKSLDSRQSSSYVPAGSQTPTHVCSYAINRVITNEGHMT